jgi:hypothetical protein
MWVKGVPKRYEYNIYPGDRSRLVSGRPDLDVRFLDVGYGCMRKTYKSKSLYADSIYGGRCARLGSDAQISEWNRASREWIFGCGLKECLKGTNIISIRVTAPD